MIRRLLIGNTKSVGVSVDPNLNQYYSMNDPELYSLAAIKSNSVSQACGEYDKLAQYPCPKFIGVWANFTA